MNRLGPSKEQPSMLRIGQTKKYKRNLKSLIILRIQWLNINSGQWLRKFVSHCVAGYRWWEEKANSKAFIEKAECRCIVAVEINVVINDLWNEGNTWTTTDDNAEKVFSSKVIPCLQHLLYQDIQ